MKITQQVDPVGPAKGLLWAEDRCIHMPPMGWREGKTGIGPPGECERATMQNASVLSYHIIYFRGSVQDCKSIWIWKMVTSIQGVQNNYNIIIIGIQPLGRSGQRPELSQATGMALVRCILGKFFGVVCHCFPPNYNIWYINYLT